MRERPLGIRRSSRGMTARLIAMLTVGCLAASMAPLWAKIEIWRQEGTTAFTKFHREHVVISDQGVARLGQELTPTGPLSAERVWDLARDKNGVVYAATGDAGKVFRLPETAGSPWTLVFDAPDNQALSLVSTSDGKVFVGTGPNGQVIELTDPSHKASRPDPSVQYIWDLAADSRGNLYAATGPTGQLWKRSAEASWTLLYDSKANHLLSVATAPDGTVYAGSDGDGLIYRVTPAGQVSVVYDAPQSEVRTLLYAPDGSLYAGTAVEAGGGSSNRSLSLRDRSAVNEDPASIARAVSRDPYERRIIPAGFVAGQAGGDQSKQAKPPTSGSAAPKPVAAGENSVYRIDPDGVAREVFRSKVLIFALSWAKDRLFIGSGPDGQLFEVRHQGAESTPVAKLDNGQILSLLEEPNGSLLIGTGDPGTVVRLSAGFTKQGELVSEVRDAKLPSQFGAISWRAETPPGTSIAIQVRSGNVGEPDKTWSDWSADQTDPASARAIAPAGRFIQYKVKLATQDPTKSPELSSVALAYRSQNLPPEITKLEVPDLTADDGSAKQTRLNLRWEVTDPNDDEMNYRVFVRKEGWPSWIALTESPITEKTYGWETNAFPSGRYQVRVTASDLPSNRAEDALNREQDSTVFVVDHLPPAVSISAALPKSTVALTDTQTRIVKAEYSVDGGPWQPAFPDDGLFDTSGETITLSPPNLKPGLHLLLIRATDAAGNVGSSDALIEVKN